MTLAFNCCQATSHILQGKLEEAEGLLQEALAKVHGIVVSIFAVINTFIPLQDSNNPEVLINLIAVSQQLGKSQEVMLTALGVGLWRCVPLFG